MKKHGIDRSKINIILLSILPKIKFMSILHRSLVDLHFFDNFSFRTKNCVKKHRDTNNTSNFFYLSPSHKIRTDEEYYYILWQDCKTLLQPNKTELH